MKIIRYSLLILTIIFLVVACGGGEEDGASPQANNSPQVTLDTSGVTNPTSTVDISVPATLPVFSTSNTPTAAPQAAQRGSLRVVHANNDLFQIDILVDEIVLERGLELYSASRSTPLDTGQHTLRVVEVSSETPRTFEQSITIEAGQAVIAVVSGNADSISVLTFNEQLDAVTPGESRVQLIHALPNVDTIQLVQAGTALVSNLTFGSQSQGVSLVADEQVLDVLRQNGTLLISVSEVLNSGQVYTIVLVGDIETNLLIPVVLESETTPQTLVRITNASTTAGNVQVLFDGQVVANNLGFGITEDFQLLPSQRYSVEVRDDGTGEPLMIGSGITLPAYQKIDLVVYGPDDALQIATIPNDPQPVPQGSARLTLFHGAPSEGRLALLGIDDFSYGLTVSYGRSGTIILAPEQAEFRLAAGDLSDPTIVEAPLNPISIESGLDYLYIVTGSSSDNPIILTSEVRIAVEGNNLPESTPAQDSIVPIRNVRLRVVNVQPEIIQVDVGETRIAVGLPNGEISQAVAIPIDFYEFQVLNESGAVLYQDSIQLQPEFIGYTFFVMNDGTNMVVIGSSEESGTPGSDVARVRIVHAFAALPEVIIRVPPTDAPNPAFDDFDFTLSFGETTGVLIVPAGFVDLEILDRSTLQVIATFPQLRFDGGQSYEVLLLQSEAGGGQLRAISRGQE